VWSVLPVGLIRIENVLTASAGIIHGDIKPENVLIFGNKTDGFVAKSSDFGYSTIVAGDDRINMPKSHPWYAPEHHHRGFKHDGAKKMDAYSFGMLCLWLLFNEKLSEMETSPRTSLGAEITVSSVEPSEVRAMRALESSKSRDR
jgi:serine/threonine protein kinase